jgi:hypothetical protein
MTVWMATMQGGEANAKANAEGSCNGGDDSRHPVQDGDRQKNAGGDFDVQHPSLPPTDGPLSCPGFPLRRFYAVLFERFL